MSDSEEDRMDVDMQFSSTTIEKKGKRIVRDLPVEAEDSLPWVEKYRPDTLDEVQGHQDILATINKFVESNVRAAQHTRQAVSSLTHFPSIHLKHESKGARQNAMVDEMNTDISWYRASDSPISSSTVHQAQEKPPQYSLWRAASTAHITCGKWCWNSTPRTTGAST